MYTNYKCREMYIVKEQSNSKVEAIVEILKELGVKVSVTKSKFEMVNAITHKEVLKLKESNI